MDGKSGGKWKGAAGILGEQRGGSVALRHDRGGLVVFSSRIRDQQ
jgi:hypothetical protein